MEKWPCGRLLARIDAITDGTTLHEDNGMVAVFTRHRCREAEQIFRLGCARYSLIRPTSALLESDLESANGQSVKNITSRLRDEVDATRDAISTLTRRIAETEAEIGAERDKAAREQEAACRREQIEKAHKAADEFTGATERLVAALQVLAPINMTTSAAGRSVKIFGAERCRCCGLGRMHGLLPARARRHHGNHRASTGGCASAETSCAEYC